MSLELPYAHFCYIGSCLPREYLIMSMLSFTPLACHDIRHAPPQTRREQRTSFPRLRYHSHSSYRRGMATRVATEPGVLATSRGKKEGTIFGSKTAPATTWLWQQNVALIYYM